MRVRPVFLLIAVSACASSGAPQKEGAATDQTVRIMGAGNTNVTLTSNAGAQVSRIEAAPDRVWLALPGAYAKVGIPISDVDTVRQRIGNSGLKLRRQLNGTSLSRFMECGSTQIGDNADSYDVFITISSTVKKDPVSGLSALETLFESQAKPVSFSREYARCSTKGLLEQRIVEAVKEQLH
ncbi:MAG: hypothetical protein ABIY52_03390 [Gemmatimonadaceae bacterium]